jgi:hypothetical protein
MIAHRHRSQSISYRRQRRRTTVLALVLFSVVVGAAGFYLGQRSALSVMSIDPEVYHSMQLELPAARQELRGLRGDLQVQRTRHEVNRGALDMLRQDMAAHKVRTADLEEELLFYKSLIAPTDVASGLSVREPELVAHAQAGKFSYRIVVQQEARKHELLKGKLEVEVFGVLGEEQVSYPLAQLSDDLDDAAMLLKFRYFQSLEGALSLPDGFQPEGLSVVASVSKPRKTEVREQFPWRLQERFTHVGK